LHNHDILRWLWLLYTNKKGIITKVLDCARTDNKLC
jgi:hypothetical protein